MSKYEHLKAPLLVGNSIIKNRFLYPNALPKILQGPEPYPADPMISFYSNMARNGAALICFASFGGSPRNTKTNFNENENRFPWYDLDDPAVENYFSILTESVHYYDSKIGLDIGIMGGGIEGYDVVDMEADAPPDESLLDGTTHITMIRPAQKQMGEEQMDQMIQKVIEKAQYYKKLGFDFGYIQPFSGTLGNFLNKKTNTRSDQYGGGFEDRARFPVEVFRRVKEALGDDFILMLDANNHLDKGAIPPYSYLSPEDAIAFFKLVESYTDIIHIRSKQIETAFDGSESRYLEPESLALAAAAKATGVKTPIASWTGFMSLELMEQAVASGKTDMLCCGRAMLANYDFGRRLKAGKDIIPCVLCNKCHGHTLTGPWVSVCTVNPLVGIEQRVHKMIEPSGIKKRVAVIGGGPAGMKAALDAAKLGHKVTLFEASEQLGGQLIPASTADFKWPMRRLRSYLKTEIEGSEVDIRLGVKATPEQIRSEGFDAAIAALGAEPVLPDIPGVQGDMVRTPITVYGREDELGKNVVCIGGSETSVETGLHLAQRGHSVTLLTRKGRLAYDANPIHYATSLRDTCISNENFNYIQYAAASNITEDGVYYTDRDGQEHFLQADSVVAAGGMKPLQNEAVAFSGAADEFYAIGDCSSVGNVQQCFRQAFSVVNRL